MKTILTAILTFLTSGFMNNLMGQNNLNVLVSIDMTQPIAQGWFNPETEKVGLRGDFRPLSWGRTYFATDENNNGVFQLEFDAEFQSDSLIIAYKIKVDGADNPNDGWQSGRNRQLVVRKNQNNNKEIAWNDEVEPLKPTFTGKVEVIKDFESHGLASREIQIYLPPGYESSTKNYPVIYMHDGQNIFDASGAGSEWMMDETAQNLIEKGIIEPMIIVGIGNTANRIDEYTPSTQIWKQELVRVMNPNSNGSLRNLTGVFVTSSNDSLHVFSRNDSLLVRIPGSHFMQQLVLQESGQYFLPMAGIYFEFLKEKNGTVDKVKGTKPPMGGKGEVYGEFVKNQLLPYIEENYRVKKDKKFRSLGGSSLGGLITAYLGLNNPDIFGNLLIISPSIWWDNKMIMQHYQDLGHRTNQKIFLYMGTNEGPSALENAREFRDLLLEKGWDNNTLKYLEGVDAGHNERAWATQVEEMLKFLYPLPN